MIYSRQWFLALHPKALTMRCHLWVWGEKKCVSVCVGLTFLQASPCPCVQCCHLLTGTNSIKHYCWHWSHTWPVCCNAESPMANSKQLHLRLFFSLITPLFLYNFILILPCISCSLSSLVHFHSVSLRLIAFCVQCLSGILKGHCKSLWVSPLCNTNMHPNRMMQTVDTPHCSRWQYVCLREKVWRLGS